jgi:arylsulfatase A-like enzyme
MHAEARRFVPRGLWLGLLLAVALVATKAVHWGWPAGSVWGWHVWLRDVAVSAHQDVAFAAAFGVVAAVLLRVARRWPRIERAFGFGLLALGAFSVLYAVASVQIFSFLRSPLTYPLLYLAGDLRAMRSSIGAFVTPGLLIAAIGATAGYVFGVWRLSRGAPRPGRAGRLVPAALVVAAGVWLWRGAVAVEGRWSDRPDVLIAENPHWKFLTSLARDWLGEGGAPAMPESFPPEFLRDFQPEGRTTDGLVPAALRSAERGAAPRRPRNVVLVVLESTGTRYLSLYGSRYPTTPRLVAEAARGMVFDDFHANVGFTANSMVALTLSVYPYMTWREYTQEYPDFPGRTVAEVLKERGYRTAFLSSGYLDYVGIDRFLRDRGFDDIKDWSALNGGRPLSSWGGEESVLIDRALAWLEREPGRPFFLQLWTQQSHHPYEPAPAQPIVDFFAGRPLPPDDYDLGRYLNTVAEVDRQVGRLFDGLRARGLADDTLVVVTSDHGEAFGDPHPTWGHGSRLYQENVQVPLLIWNPRLFPTGGRDRTIGALVDLNPTLLDVLGLPAPEGWEGRSLFTPDRPPRAYFYAANDDYLLGVREGDVKYIYNATRGREELYDLRRDPDERQNAAAAHPERCRVLRQRLAAWKHHAGRRLEAVQSRTLAAAY